jgi:3-deoxy-7-phosphoheptulonate synthase
MSRVRDTRIVSYEPLLSPAALLDELRLTEHEAQTVERTRAEVRAVLDGADDRLLVVTGPCSVHDPKAALEYARRLIELRETCSRDLLIVMRVYFEKPRTVTGWKGLINDPLMDDSYDVHRGLRTARRLLIDILSLGMPVGCEWLDPITPQYIADTVTWGAIGARTTESQVHRQLASGLSMPVGFKNGTDGDVQVAVDACRASAAGHTFFGVTSAGAAAVVSTSGNVDTHVILRGGRSGPNYSASHVAKALDLIAAAGLPRRLMVDASHDNSGKDYRRQPEVAQTLAEQVTVGERGVCGVMLESFLVAGRQNPGDPATLTYGQSVTDACMDIEMTAATLETLAAAVSSRRQSSSDLSRTVPDRLEPGELGADPFSVGVVEFVEDYQSPLPGVVGGVRVTSGEVDATEAGEGIGLLITVTELPDQGEGVPEARDGPGMVPKLVVSEAEAVPGMSLAVQVTEFCVHNQSLLA